MVYCKKKLLYHLQNKICCLEPSSLQDASPCGLPKQQEVQEGVRITGEWYAFDHWEQRFHFDSAVRGKAIESGKKFEKKIVLVFLPSPSVLRCYARMSGGGGESRWKVFRLVTSGTIHPACLSPRSSDHRLIYSPLLPPSSFLSFCTEGRIAFASGWILGSKYLTPSSAL